MGLSLRSTDGSTVVGDHPGVHGGIASGIPFTGREWSGDFFDRLTEAGLVQRADVESDSIACHRTFLSYLHQCEPDDCGPDEQSYAELEPYFDAELRAITAHFLIPVGERATRHVLQSYTSTTATDETEMEGRHASEIHGAGWLVVPCKDPGAWTDGDGDMLVDRLVTLQDRDYTGRRIPVDGTIDSSQARRAREESIKDSVDRYNY